MVMGSRAAAVALGDPPTPLLAVFVIPAVVLWAVAPIMVPRPPIVAWGDAAARVRQCRECVSRRDRGCPPDRPVRASRRRRRCKQEFPGDGVATSPAVRFVVSPLTISLPSSSKAEVVVVVLELRSEIASAVRFRRREHVRRRLRPSGRFRPLPVSACFVENLPSSF